jgi:hypothetical protein
MRNPLSQFRNEPIECICVQRAIDEPIELRAVGVEIFARQDDFKGPRAPDEEWQPLSSPCAWQ